MSGLRECPFCGAAPTLRSFAPHQHALATFMPDHPGSWAVECEKCGAGQIRDDEAEAIAAWNARPEPPAGEWQPIHTLRWERLTVGPEGVRMPSDDLKRHGDTVAVWINEGDLVRPVFEAARQTVTRAADAVLSLLREKGPTT